MSSFETSMSTTSTIVSRRLFAKSALATMAAAAGIVGGREVLAQEVGVDPEDQNRYQTEQSSSDSSDPVVSTDTNGQFIVDFALQFVGYPYVWAGNTPAGFDCSGFTQYVILNTVGIDIGHATGGQVGYGAWVDAADLQPGDLVYFANTFGSGVSHAGIYIGDGQFVHAENEGTGVTIGWVWSDYYAAHYYGATRHW